MADLLKTLKNEELVRISADFDYLSVTNDFVGLKLLPPLYVHNNDGSYTEIINKMFKSKEE